MIEEPINGFQALKAPDVLQHYHQVTVEHHEGRGEHGVLPPVPYNPKGAGPDEEDEGKPAHIRYAPGLPGRGSALSNTKLPQNP